MKNNFCIIPWISITSDNAGLVRPCCKFAEKDFQEEYQTPSLKDYSYEDIWNGPEMQAIRQAFLDDKKIPECSSCWKEEAAGLTSYRNQYNHTFLRQIDPKDYSTTYAEPPRVVDLKLSNVCNFKCRMCDFSYSSLILKEDKAFRGYDIPDESYYLSNKILNTENEDYFFEKIVPNLIQIEFTGGEPFVSPEARKLIDILSQSEFAKNIAINITTNGSKVNTLILSQLDKFKFVRIGLSVDDIGSRAEYQRKGTVWETVSHNCKLFNDNKKFYVNLHPTINNYSIWNFDKTLEWAKENNIKVVTNILHGPERLCIKNLSPYSKSKVYEKYKDNKAMVSILSYMMQDGEDLTKDFIRETEWIDSIRNESFKEVFPDWSKIIYGSLQSPS